MHEDLDAVINWSTRWQLPFNETKCKSLHIGKKNHCQTYRKNGYTLEQVTDENDLGIIIDNELKFHKHTAMAIKVGRDHNIFSPYLGSKKVTLCQLERGHSKISKISKMCEKINYAHN